MTAALIFVELHVGRLGGTPLSGRRFEEGDRERSTDSHDLLTRQRYPLAMPLSPVHLTPAKRRALALLAASQEDVLSRC